MFSCPISDARYPIYGSKHLSPVKKQGITDTNCSTSLLLLKCHVYAAIEKDSRHCK